ncbi:MAG: hypothetical protein E7403_06600, partial [Ruminococcaceae bacterium]|nr:hypothetical protein [Oscillospiraceae bacterium]
KGMSPTVESTVSKDFHVLVSKNKMNSIEKKITLSDSVPAPIHIGDKLGEAEFFIDGKPIGGTDIVAGEAVNKIGFMGMFGKLMKQLLFGTSSYHLVTAIK